MRRFPSRWTLALSLLLAAAIARLWVVPLTASFWVDEMVTVFIVRHPDHPSLAAVPQLRHSLYYPLVQLSQNLFGTSEIAYRLPSLVVMLAALWFIGSLARRLIAPGGAWFAIFACLSLRFINFSAADARPYSLGILFSASALFFLVRWLDSRHWWSALLFAILAAALWRVHLVFWPFYFVFPLYAASRIARRDTAVTWTQAALVFSCLALSLLPVVLDAAAVLGGAGAHVVSPRPGLRELSFELKLGLIGGCALAAWVAGRTLGLTGESPAIRRPDVSSCLLIAAWWLCQPLGLFAFSWVTGNSVFLSRYIALSLPGAALAATLAAGWFLPPRAWRCAAFGFGAFVLVLGGNWTHNAPWHSPSEWRAAAQAVRVANPEGGLPVICPSPFIEAKWPVWNPEYPLPGFLYAHLDYYPVPGQILRFPIDQPVQATAYAAKLLQGTLQDHRAFLIYGSLGGVTYWQRWMEARPELAGWKSTPLGNFGDVKAVRFAAPTSASTAPRTSTK